MSMLVRSAVPVVSAIFALFRLADATAQPPPPAAISSPIPRGTLDPRGTGRANGRRAARGRARSHRRARARALPGRRLLRRRPARPAAGGRAAARACALRSPTAWRGPDATTKPPAQYRELFGTPYDARARVGLANVLRWRGQAHLAEPYYQEVLGREPANAGCDRRAGAGRTRPAPGAHAARHAHQGSGAAARRADHFLSPAGATTAAFGWRPACSARG